MEAKLGSGTTLIVDRYSFSGVAFSSAKGLDIEWCKVSTCFKLLYNCVSGFFFFLESVFLFLGSE